MPFDVVGDMDIDCGYRLFSCGATLYTPCVCVSVCLCVNQLRNSRSVYFACCHYYLLSGHQKDDPGELDKILAELASIETRLEEVDFDAASEQQGETEHEI